MGGNRDVKKKTGLKKLFSRIIKRKTGEKSEKDQTEKLQNNDDVTHDKQPNDGNVESLESVQGNANFDVVENKHSSTGVQKDSSQIIKISTMPVENLPRNRRPLMLAASEEAGLFNLSTNQSGINSHVHAQCYPFGEKPKSPNTEKALQLLQKLEAKRKGDITNNPGKIFQRSRRSRSNKPIVTLLQNTHSGANIASQNGLTDSSYESMNSDVQSLASQSIISFEEMDVGTPLATSTLQKPEQVSAKEDTSVKNKKVKCENQANLKKSTKEVFKQDSDKENMNTMEILKSEEMGKVKSKSLLSKIHVSQISATDKKKSITCKSTHKCSDKLIQNNKKENVDKITMDTSEPLVVDKPKQKSSGTKHKSSEDKSRRKRQSKITDKTSMQPLIKKLDDKVPITLPSTNPDSVVAFNKTTSNQNENEPLSEAPRPIIHYHVTIQNCDGININVNKSDNQSFIPHNIEVSHDGKLQKLSWIEDPATPLPIGECESFIGPLTNSNESWSGTSTSTIVAGYETGLDDNQSIISCETNTTVLVSTDINIDDARSDITSDTTYLVDADAWGCDGLQDDDFEHLSVCEHRTDYNESVCRSLRDQFERSRSNHEPFHLNRNSSFSKSVPARLSRHSRATSSPAYSRSKDFIPPWRSESTHSVPSQKAKSNKQTSVNTKYPLERSQSSTVIARENFSHNSSQSELKSKIPTRKASTKSKPSAASRLFHNLLNPLKHNLEDKGTADKNENNKKDAVSNSASNVSDKEVLPKRNSKKRFSSFRKKFESDSKHKTKTDMKETVIPHMNSDIPNNYNSTQVSVQNNTLSSMSTAAQQCPGNDNNNCPNIKSETTLTSVDQAASAHSDIATNVPIQLTFEDIDYSSSALQHTNNADNSVSSSRHENNTCCKIKSSESQKNSQETNNTKKVRPITPFEDKTCLNSNRPITPFEDKNTPNNNKPVAKVIPVARVSPQTVSNSVTSTNYSSTATPSYSTGANAYTTSSAYTANTHTTGASLISSYANDSNQSAFSLVSPNHLHTSTSSPAISYTPAYSFSSSYSRRYTPIFDTTSPVSSSTSARIIQSNNPASRSTTPTRRSGRSTTPVRSSVSAIHRNETLDLDTSSDSTLVDENETVISPAFDDSTLSLLAASPHIMLVDEDVEATSSRQNFSRYGLGSTIQPTLRRQSRNSGNSDRSRGRRRSNNGPTFEERIAILRGEIVRVPGVLILSTRRNRMVVYLSQDRPNVEGVFEFMQQHGISRADYEVEILPWGNRGSAGAMMSGNRSTRSSSVQLSSQTAA